MRQKVEYFCLLWYNYIVSDEDMYLHLTIAVKGQGKKNKLTFVKLENSEMVSHWILIPRFLVRI